MGTTLTCDDCVFAGSDDFLQLFVNMKCWRNRAHLQADLLQFIDGVPCDT